MVRNIDPLRAEILLAIERCTTAGLTVLMVTGDDAATAISILIAKKAGILPRGFLISDDLYVVILRYQD